MKASKYEMKGLQGLCVLAMIALHLFCRTDYIYSPTLYLFNIPLCYYIGQFGDFCVMGFCVLQCIWSLCNIRKIT